jgi:hypothetical protein
MYSASHMTLKNVNFYEDKNSVFIKPKSLTNIAL